jgi:protein O-mannosyl-transferase
MALLVAALALLSVAALAVYGRALHSPFVFDDESAITQNPSIVRLWPLFGDTTHRGPLNPPKDLPTSGRPLANLALALNYYFGQLDPFGYHLFNLIVHVLIATLLVLMAERLLRLDYFQHRFDGAVFPLSLTIGLLWLLHPLQTEPVQYVTQRTELMCGFFYLVTLYASLRYFASRSWFWIIIASVCCVLGMISKEMMASAPLAVLLMERTFVTGSFRLALRRSWRLYVAFIPAMLLLFCISIRHPYAGSVGFYKGVSAHQWWLTQAKVLWMYGRLCVWPWPLSVHYDIDYLSFAAALPWLLLTFGLIVAIAWGVWRRSSIAFAFAWVMLLLLPTMIVPLPTEIAAERRMYLPLAAILSVIVAGIYTLVRKTTRGPQFATALAVCVALAWGFVSAARLNAYHDQLFLWQETIAQNPSDAFAQFNVGSFLNRAGRYDESLAYFQRALAIKSDLYSKADVYNSIGHALVGMGRPREAIPQFQEALKINPDDANAHTNLGIALVHLGQLPEAIQEYREALQLNANLELTHYNLAIALAAAGQTQQAVDEYEQTLQLNPDNAFAHNNLGILLARTGRRQEALEHFQRAVQIRPDYANARQNLNVMLQQMGKAPEAN